MEEKNESIFIGAKALSDNQVKLIVPTFDYILKQIDEIREEAGKSGKKDINTKQYNNTIGLFGERGTGKTSTLYTLINKLGGPKSPNIILDIIEPDTYGENTKIIGAVLRLLYDQVKNIEDELNKSNNDRKYEVEGFFQDCRFKKNNELERSYNELLEFYCYKEDEYRSLLTKHYSDMETFKKKYQCILSPDYEFKKKLNEFINMLIKGRKSQMKVCHGIDEEPLLFIIIDDIDLKTTKCKELVDSVMQYMCHPNVVCILSGDYEILQESVTMALLDSEGIVKSNLGSNEVDKIFNGDMSLVKRKKYLTQEYLKKILPPAFRHSVVKWTTDNIPYFSFNFEGSETSKPQGVMLYEKLNELLGDYSLFNYRYNSEKLWHPSTSYEIFDKTPRGLVNVLYYIMRYKEQNLNWNNKESFKYIKELIDTIINSNSNFINYKKEFYDNMLVWGADEESSTLNFGFIKMQIPQATKVDKLESKKAEELINKLILQFYLLSFVKDFSRKHKLNINIENYEYAKEKVLYMLATKLKIKDSEIIYDKKDKEDSENKLTECELVLQELLYNLDFNTSNFLANYLSKSMRNQSKYDEEELYFDLCEIMKEENIAIHFLKNWIKLDFEYSSTRKIINFLRKYSLKNDESVKISKMYDEIIDADYKVEIGDIYQYDKMSKTMKKHVLSKEDNIYEVYLKELLCSGINEHIESGTVDVISDKQIYKILKNIIQQEGKLDTNKFTKAVVYRLYEKYCRDLSGKIQERLKNIKINVKLSQEDISLLLDRCGKDTIAKRTGHRIKDLQERNDNWTIEEFVEIIRRLDYVVYVSYTYIGVNECLKLKDIIMRTSRIIFTNQENSFLSEEDIAILKLYKRYKEIYDGEFIKIINLKEKRNKMKVYLEKAFTQVAEEAGYEARRMGIELDDLEESSDEELINDEEN